MKAWDEAAPRRTGRRRRVPPWPAPLDSSGLGLVRRDLIVLDPATALRGEEPFELAVLEDPDTGTWYGEDSRWPGSAVSVLDRSGLLAPSEAGRAALRRVAATVRETRSELLRRAETRRRRWARARALTIVETLGAAVPGTVVLDAREALRGRPPGPFEWLVTQDGNLLRATFDNPDGAYAGWVTDPERELLVPDARESRAALAALAELVAARRALAHRRVERAALRVGQRCLADLLPRSEVPTAAVPTDRRAGVADRRLRVARRGGGGRRRRSPTLVPPHDHGSPAEHTDEG